MVRKIILDTDPGIDDAMAIHMAFADPRLEVIGMTTIFGNVRTDQATRNALHLAEMASYDTVVARGASAPMTRDAQPPADFVHGPEGFGRLSAATPSRAEDGRSAAQYLCDTCAAAPGEITIVAVGPLTNLAAALTYDPAIAQHARNVVIMGGSAAYHGNVSDCAEANIWNDPHAADAVFAADWQVTMVGLDVTEKTQCTPDDFEGLADRAPIIGGFLRDAADFYFDFHENKTGRRICFMHDPSAILAVTDPQLFGFDSAPITVTCDGEELGRTVVDPDGKTGRLPVQIAMTVDSTAARDIFLALIANADKHAHQRASHSQ